MQFANKCKALGLNTTAMATATAASRAEGSEGATAAEGRAHLTGLPSNLSPVRSLPPGKRISMARLQVKSLQTGYTGKNSEKAYTSLAGEFI